MKILTTALITCLCLVFCACNDNELKTKTDFSKSERVVETYYKSLFNGDYATAHSLLYERDRWFVFENEFESRFRLNTFPYPQYTAYLFDYKITALNQEPAKAAVTVQVTVPDLTELTTTLGERLFDATYGGPSDKELRSLVDGTEYDFKTLTFTHHLIKDEDVEGDIWFMFFDFETEEAVAQLVRRGDFNKDSGKLKELAAARENYEKALVLLPGNVKALEGLATVETNVALLQEKDLYIKEKLELFDFVAKDYKAENTEQVAAPGVTFKLRNNGDKVVTKIWVKVTFLNADGSVASAETIEPLNDYVHPAGGQVNDPLMPGEIWQFQDPAFYMTISTGAKWQADWQPGQGNAVITDIEFADEENSEKDLETQP